MKLVILDTNVLILFDDLDVFSKIKEVVQENVTFAVLEESLRELERLKKGKTAQAYIKAKNIQIIPGEGHADDLLVEQAKDGALIATIDRELQKRIKGKILLPRQKKYFVLT